MSVCLLTCPVYQSFYISTLPSVAIVEMFSVSMFILHMLYMNVDNEKRKKDNSCNRPSVSLPFSANLMRLCGLDTATDRAVTSNL